MVIPQGNGFIGQRSFSQRSALHFVYGAPPQVCFAHLLWIEKKPD